MKKLLLLAFMASSVFTAFAQDESIDPAIDSLEKTFHYQHGTVDLKGGIGKITIPPGFKYLDPTQAERVLVDLWGNPKDEGLTLGMLFREADGVMTPNSYAFNIQYNEIGYVEDDDADDIDYTELLAQIQKDSEEENKERATAGYEPITMVGWASTPFYDKDRKILHWAKELKFGKSEVNTLNYNIRVLGRKGVLVINAIASMPELGLVKADIDKVLNIVEFSDGYKYKDFDPKIDEVAAWTIGGLVAGKVLAKAGILVFLLKFWKIIALAVGGGATFLWKKIRRKKEEENLQLSAETEEVVQETNTNA